MMDLILSPGERCGKKKIFFNHSNRKERKEMEGEVVKLPKTYQEKENAKRLIVVLEGAQLETVKVGNEFQLLNSDDHANICKKRKRDIADARPDITHQVTRSNMSISIIL